MLWKILFHLFTLCPWMYHTAMYLSHPLHSRANINNFSNTFFYQFPLAASNILLFQLVPNNGVKANVDITVHFAIIFGVNWVSPPDAMSHLEHPIYSDTLKTLEFKHSLTAVFQAVVFPGQLDHPCIRYNSGQERWLCDCPLMELFESIYCPCVLIVEPCPIIALLGMALLRRWVDG